MTWQTKHLNDTVVKNLTNSYFDYYFKTKNSELDFELKTDEKQINLAFFRFVSLNQSFHFKINNKILWIDFNGTKKFLTKDEIILMDNTAYKLIKAFVRKASILSLPIYTNILPEG